MKYMFLALLACGASSTASAQNAPSDPPDPSHMSRAALQAEVEASRPLLQNGGVNPSRPPGCISPESHQLDFWIGEWDVSPTDQRMVVGEAAIVSVSQGCGILQDFRPFAGAEGRGLFAFDPSVGKWRQAFVDATGVYGTAEGGFLNDMMSFEIVSPPPPSRFPADMRRRINFQRIDDDTVRQWGERLDPITHNWVSFFDFTYRRRGPR